jgi:hypothetical protein
MLVHPAVAERLLGRGVRFGRALLQRTVSSEFVEEIPKVVADRGA